ncbi:hypothetical protein JY651_15530 [Pyxidicoccus parkwayensis]|uniref:Uncharacterized protein n=1 Tax=Pyxidicoccus parkwayensis TaxID=2813578 RepID=A0ABX7P723_9BACT|nr:hypothetical protein [Pyxidicoccus parkwaysis]QSQ26252.1 hypothetical protein JY651_15530 [Pyxidicoccus parkwaysis]
MNPSRACVLLFTALLSACSSSTSLPNPDILSVTPNQVIVPRELPVEQRVPIRVSLDAVIPVRVDYGNEQVTTDVAKVWIGPAPATVQWVGQDGTLTVVVPDVLDKGSYDVRVALPDGREASRASVLSLILPDDDSHLPVDPDPDSGTLDPEDAGPLILTDAGTEEDGGLSPGQDDAGVQLPEDGGLGPNDPIRPGDITGFTLDTLGDQAWNTPFPVTVRAIGPRAAHFQDSVELTVNKTGAVSPLKLGPFVNGLCVQPVTVQARGANVKLTVTDAYGAQGTSNGFKVQ